jgi:localization factor PodJL
LALSPRLQNEAPYFAGPQVSLSSLEQQLREISRQIDALRPVGKIETAINSLRGDLVEIGRSFTEALPRRALESLEIEVTALAQRIDHSRQSGIDATALAGVEHGLTEVREALQTLTPAESLVGFEEAVRALGDKVDAIGAREDPAALQQLETAIGALRGIVSRVASNDALTRVAEDVRALAAKVDVLANNTANWPNLSALEERIELLANAVNASAEAGHAVPRELERLLSGLIEKLEWVQLTHTDHTALAHLEDKIATLVKRLEVSDARLGLLEAIERGLADLLVYIEQLRSTNGEGDTKKLFDVPALKHEVTRIDPTERRTQEAPQTVQSGAKEGVERLATIDVDVGIEKGWLASAELLPANTQNPAPAAPLAAESVPVSAAESVPMTAELAQVPAGPKPSRPEPTPPRVAAARAPIDPNLPPDHPLEPGSAPGRSRNPASAADRIAASEAALGSKPPVIPDPGGGKADFIAAARRAAQAAASAAPQGKSGPEGGSIGSQAPAKKLTDRLRTLAVAGAVVVIVVGGFHIISRMFADSGPGATSHGPVEPPRAPSPPLQLQTEPLPAQPQKLQEQIEPPHAQAEPPVQPQALPSPAPAQAGASQAKPPVTHQPLPGANSAQNPEAPPSAPPAPATGAGLGQQSDGKDTAAPPVPPTGASSAAGETLQNVANHALLGLPTDVTGALGPAMPQQPALAAAKTGDKLPVAIGAPALRAAALAGDPSAAYEVAVRFADGRVVPANNEEAALWFDRAARKGLTAAQFRLGALYEKGLGVNKDLAVARDFYRAAADKGHGKAMHNLAVLYAEGINGAPDYRAAAEWFRKAAERGITDSQYNLAILYARGVGVEQDLVQAYKWFFLAAQEGDKGAAQKRDEVGSHLDAQDLTAARLEAQTFKPLPQPPDTVTVKGAWDAPTNTASPAKTKPRSAKASVPDAAKIN